jgi:hypothetical protein
VAVLFKRQAESGSGTRRGAGGGDCMCDVCHGTLSFAFAFPRQGKGFAVRVPTTWKGTKPRPVLKCFPSFSSLIPFSF